VEVWGSGTPRREFLHVDDLADVAVYLMGNYSGVEIVNIGIGEDIGICELTELMPEVVEFGGGLVFDTSRPGGTP
jgi:GDP-L-fucose synthase